MTVLIPLDFKICSRSVSMNLSACDLTNGSPATGATWQDIRGRRRDDSAVDDGRMACTRGFEQSRFRRERGDTTRAVLLVARLLHEIQNEDGRGRGIDRDRLQ